MARILASCAHLQPRDKNPDATMLFRLCGDGTISGVAAGAGECAPIQDGALFLRRDIQTISRAL